MRSSDIEAAFMISASVDTTKLKNDDDRDYEVIFTCPPQSLEQRLLFQGRSRLQSPYSPSPSPNAPDDNVMFMVREALLKK